MGIYLLYQARGVITAPFSILRTMILATGYAEN